MFIELSIAAQGIEEDELQQLTREMRDALRDENVEAELVTAASPAGAKGGEWEMIGQLVLKGLGLGLGGGGGVAVFNVLKTYLQRKPTLEIEIKRKGGDTIKVKADDLSKDERRAVLQQFLSNEEKQ